MGCVSPYYVKEKRFGHLEEFAVPCGRCDSCKRTRINQWVFRLEQQDKVAHSSYFVTLTYDNDYVPITENRYLTLVKEDFQKYIKRLRWHDREARKRAGDFRYYKDIPSYNPIRYYACGEYGSKRARPHYHAIIFDVYDEESIFKAWKLGKVHIGTVTEESIAYTAKYIDKTGAQKIPKFYLKDDDRIPEFSLQSTKLGINYVQEIIKKDGSRDVVRPKESTLRYHKADLTRNFVTTRNGYKVPIPRYYAERIFTEEENDRRRILAKKSLRESDARSRREHRNKFSKETRSGREGFKYSDVKREQLISQTQNKNSRQKKL